MSQSDLRLQFGLGSADRADSIEVQWLNGDVEKIGFVKSGQIVTITEGKGVTAKMPYARWTN